MPVVALASSIYSAFGSKAGQAAAPVSSGINSSGSDYELGSAASLISNSNGVSNMNLLVIGAIALGAIFILGGHKI